MAVAGPDLAFVVDLALRAGRIVMEGHRAQKQVDLKMSVADVVTEFDVKTEKFIISEVLKKFPAHKFIGEETEQNFKMEELSKEPTWIIDPIDGTANFVTSHPLHCISIAYAENGALKFGVVYIPMANEMFAAEKGKPATLNGEFIHVSEEKEAGRSIISTGFCTGFCHKMASCPEEYEKVQSMKKTVRGNLSNLLDNFADIRRHGACAIDCCYVACGRTQGMCEIGPHPWDYAAGALIVQSAGGFTGGFKDNKLDLFKRHIVCANTARMLEDIQTVIKPSPIPWDQF